MPIDPTASRNSHDQPPTQPKLHLVPKSLDEAILFLFKAFHEFPDEIRLAMYAETLEGCSLDEVWQVIKVWSRQPHDRAAHAGELRDMILTARGSKVPVQEHEQEWEQHRATPEEKQEVIRQLTPKARALLREACPWLFQEEQSR
jgi:hypothetical protein